MSGLNYLWNPDVVRAARQERDRVVYGLGSRLVSAPAKLIKLGVDDFRRYRQPKNV